MRKGRDTSLNAFNNIPGRDRGVGAIMNFMIQLILLRTPLIENCFYNGGQVPLDIQHRHFEVVSESKKRFFWDYTYIRYLS